MEWPGFGYSANGLPIVEMGHFVAIRRSTSAQSISYLSRTFSGTFHHNLTICRFMLGV